MRLAIVGTRKPSVTYHEWEKLLLDKINPDDIQTVISGGAKGVDSYAKLFAARHHKPYMESCLNMPLTAVMRLSNAIHRL